MYQSCNRRLLPSMATSTLFSPSSTSKPCSLHSNSASHDAIHRSSALGLQSLSRRSCEKSRTCLNVGFLPFWDCIYSRSHATCCCFYCRRDCVSRASFCVKACANSASMASSLLGPGKGSYLNMRTLSGFAGSPSAETSGKQTRTRASTTSVALTSKKKTKAKSAGSSAQSAESPAIQQPSLTWGIVPHPQEGKQKVIEFLQKEGVDTAELQDVELPNTIEVMQERLDFLKKLGLSMEAINSYPLMVTCSIKKNLIPVLDYLEQLGLRSKELPKFIEKYPMVLHASIVIDLMPVVDYLLGLDIQRKDVIKVLSRYPDVLGFRLEGTMSTSVAYLVSLGVRMRCIGRMLTEYPEILGMRVANTIKPKVDFLLSYGIPKPIVAKLLEVRPYMLGFDLSDTMEPVVNDLMEAGVRKEGIASIITQYPDILGQGIRENLNRKTKWLVQEMQVEPKNIPVIIEKLPQILFIKEGLAMERVRLFRDAGLSVEDVATMVTECPQILALSIGQVIEPSLNFLLHEMKRSVKEVVKFPAYFTYDLKSRIMPRYRLIAEKGVDCSLEWFLNCTEQRFKMRLSADYLEDDETGPVFQMGGVVHTEIKPVEEEDASLDEDLDSEGRRREEPRFSASRGRQTTKFHHQQKKNKHLGTASDSDIEAFSGDEDELGMYESPSAFSDEDDDDDEIELKLRGVGNGIKAMRTGNQEKTFNTHRRQQDMYSEDEDTDNETEDANDILQARLRDSEDLDMLESASELDESEEEEEEEERDDDDEGEEWSMSETASEFYERGEDIDDDELDEETEEEEQHRATNKRIR